MLGWEGAFTLSALYTGIPTNSNSIEKGKTQSELTPPWLLIAQ